MITVYSGGRVIKWCLRWSCATATLTGQRSAPWHWWSWHETRAAEKHRIPVLIIACISLTAGWSSAWRHTCDRRRSVVGLSEILLDFFPWLFFTWGLSGTSRSNLTLVSPTHRAKYLLNGHTTCSHLNLKQHEVRWCSFVTTLQRHVTYGKSWFSSLLEIQILSTSCHEERGTVIL